MHKIILIVLAVVILSAILIVIFPYTKRNTTVTIDNKTFSVELATTDTAREYGLMNRKSLDASAGMLFVFPDSDIRTFWMKNTLIPLDIIFIDNNKIVDMTTLKPPIDKNIPQYASKEKAQYVLEINAGLSKKYGFKIDDEVNIKY